MSDIFDPRPRPRRQFAGPVQGRVQSVTATGIMFTIDGHGPAKYGPAKWQRPQTPAPAAVEGVDHQHTVAVEPPAGTVCCVVFARGAEGDVPWIVAFDGWPGA